jgi:hypothetical protein
VPCVCSPKPIIRASPICSAKRAKSALLSLPSAVLFISIIYWLNDGDEFLAGDFYSLGGVLWLQLTNKLAISNVRGVIL